jgi:hypothetical protein
MDMVGGDVAGEEEKKKGRFLFESDAVLYKYDSKPRDT